MLWLTLLSTNMQPQLCKTLLDAYALQLELSKRLPLCYATLLGTHNSGISLADGYGNLDLAYQHYFRWISWVVCQPFLTSVHSNMPSLALLFCHVLLFFSPWAAAHT